MHHLHYYIAVLYLGNKPVGWLYKHCYKSLNQIEMNQFFRENWK